MVFRISSLSNHLISTCIGICMVITACNGTSPVNSVAAPQIQPTCVSSTVGVNPYITHVPSQNVRDIYLNSFTNPSIARQEALVLLGKNTEHWSDKVDIAIDNTHMVRVVITYIDPILVDYIILNHFLNTLYLPNGSNNVPSTPVSMDQFDYEIAQRMRKLGERNEMLFVVTITTPFYQAQAFNSNVLTVRIPVNEMTLVSGADIRVVPTHDDHILEENIDITHGPVAGILGYPLAVLNRDQCTWLMDQYTTTLTLDVPRVILGATEFGSQFWSIPYQPLVMQSDIHANPTYDPNFATPISELRDPPTPNWNPNAQDDTTAWPAYWEDMGRYLWNIVITASHH
jgi:hypothetical protein